MKMFFLKFILLASCLFVSVLFGMQLAQDGIHRMKGYEDANFKEVLQVNEENDGEIEVSVLGNEVSSHDLNKKKEKLEEMKAYNFFSNIGKKFAETMSALTEKTLQLLTDLLS
ncbi:YqxA family protein [Bacillus dakarensis]|uniref:YqxA family protein n=1 Tax=Robertmurraya dakarensis TaxID=1926278 RepID=UPI0009824B05|nr:YqxA family protein [Bacillus dakarensis]